MPESVGNVTRIGGPSARASSGIRRGTRGFRPTSTKTQIDDEGGTEPETAVSGATGEIGIRVARGLVDRGTAQRLIVRDTGRAPSIEGAELSVASGYHNDDGMRRALEAVPGVGTTVSNHVERVAGHAPEALVPFLRARPELWHHLVATS